MTLPNPRDLAVMTLRNPAGAAQRVMGLGIPREALWMALGLLAVAQAMFYLLSAYSNPAPIYDMIGSPLRYLLLAGCTLVLSVFAMHRVGHALGGSGSLDDVLSLTVWLQAINLALQLTVLVVGLILPVLAGLVFIVAGVFEVFIMLHFVDQAHRLESLWRALLVLIGTVLAVFVGLALVQMVIGLPSGVLPGNV